MRNVYSRVDKPGQKKKENQQENQQQKSDTIETITFEDGGKMIFNRTTNIWKIKL
jgi:hypothetical protein